MPLFHIVSSYLGFGSGIGPWVSPFRCRSSWRRMAKGYDKVPDRAPPVSGGFPLAERAQEEPSRKVVERICWADGERPWYGTMDKVQVQDFIEDPEDAMPALHFHVSRPWSPERRQRCRTWIIGGSLISLVAMASMLAMVVLLGGKEKAMDKEAPKLPLEARAHPPAGMALDVAVGDSQWVPDGAWTIPTPMGCLEAKCEGHMAAMGKGFADHYNMGLLDCIQRTGMSNEEAMKCFRAAKVESSEIRSALYECGICKRCLAVAGEMPDDHCNVASGPASPSVLNVDSASSSTASLKVHNSIPATASDSP